MIPFFIDFYPLMQYINHTTRFESVRNKIFVSGYAYLINNNNFFEINKNIEKETMPNNKILIIRGKVKANLGKRYLIDKDLKGMNSINTFTDKNGIFKIVLTPGIYTFFIFKDKIYYCNEFDGEGFFKSYKIDINTREIRLDFDKNSLY